MRVRLHARISRARWVDERACQDVLGLGVCRIYSDSASFNLECPGGKELYRMWIEAVFLFQNSRTQAFFRVIVKDGYYCLGDDGACVNICINKVNRATGESGTVFQGFFLHIQAGKRREQSRVDIHDAMRECIDKIGPYDAHETGENHEIYLVLLQLLYNRSVERCAGFKVSVVDAAAGDMGAFCTLQGTSIRIVADYAYNLGIDISFATRIDNRL
jgi:hypothetical protein